tara:strand:- start:65 stop:298 length:234 start_codon:yes stop_codon:yes gene_type:complete
MRQSLLKKKNPKTVKEKQIQVAIDSTKNYDTLFGKGTAKELFDKYRKDGMSPKSAARSTLRMLKKMEFDELMDRFNS